MPISPLSPSHSFAPIAPREPAFLPLPGSEPAQPQGRSNAKLEETFSSFVGQTFYGQLLKSMRSTQDKPAYFHGGRAEETFQGQFDQVIAERLSESTAETFSEPMLKLFMLQRN